MNCTQKEWDTCGVEKRGCDGCYYSSFNKLDVTSVPEKEMLKKKDSSVFIDKK